MAMEFTPHQILSLLRPSWLAMRNRRRQAGKGDWLRVLLFAALTVLFGLFIFASFYRMLLYVGRFAEFTAPLTHQILGTVSAFILTVLFASTVITALSNQYLSEDLSLLVSSPVPLPALYGSRLILTGLQSSWMVLLFCLPIYLAFAVTSPAPVQFLTAVGLTLLPMMAIACSTGSILTSLLMASFPAKRVREMLVLLGVFFVILVVFLIRMQQPEKLLNPRSIYDVSDFFATFRTPASPFLPSSWMTELLIAGRRASPLPWMPLALLWSSASASVIVGCWLARGLYWRGYSRAQESRPARISTLPVVDRLFSIATRPFELRFRSLLLKDLRTFARDTTQWSQLLLLLALVVVYLYNFSVLPANFTFAQFYLQNLFSFLNLGLAGFVLSAVAVRFVFTSVSVEGRSFWIIRTSPLTTRKFLWSKFWSSIPPLLILSQVLTLCSNYFLSATPFMTVLSSVSILLVTFGIVGLGVGLGAVFPRFKFENVTQIAGSSGGLIYMISSTSFIAAVLALEALPVFLYLRANYTEVPVDARARAIIAACLAGVVLLNVLAVWLPMRWGERRLGELEI